MRVLQLTFAIASIIFAVDAAPTPTSIPGFNGVASRDDQKTCGHYRILESAANVEPTKLVGGAWVNVGGDDFEFHMSKFIMDTCTLCMIYSEADLKGDVLYSGGAFTSPDPEYMRQLEGSGRSYYCV